MAMICWIATTGVKDITIICVVFTRETQLWAKSHLSPGLILEIYTKDTIFWKDYSPLHTIHLTVWTAAARPTAAANYTGIVFRARSDESPSGWRKAAVDWRRAAVDWRRAALVICDWIADAVVRIINGMIVSLVAKWDVVDPCSCVNN